MNKLLANSLYKLCDRLFRHVPNSYCNTNNATNYLPRPLFVILDLHAKVNEFIPADETEKRDSVFVQVGDQRAEVEMDSTNFSTCRLSTTLRCPKEQIVLAGGMTYQSGNAKDQPNMYLFVKTSVHTIAEDESDWTRNSKNSESDAASKNSKSSVKEKATSKK